MAIISGGRINIWNAVKKQFETVHPETEVARITDFADGIVQKLALTSAMTAVTALQTDSWFGKLLKMALTASGVKYSIAQNGYVCLGSLFGGLIIQWGYNSIGSSDYFSNITYPISFGNTVLGLIPYDVISNFSQSKGLTVNLSWVTDKSNLKTGNVASNCAGAVVGMYRYLVWGK